MGKERKLGNDHAQFCVFQKNVLARTKVNADQAS